ncbi:MULTISPECIES: hypothetical protein [Streptomyces]|uniref:hypothetical protein n=1 Tax=Streptomyces TaxID=1883 RepID=UPI0002F02B9A|nr:hypothetical protein [Streptomyces venezuelae]APE24428.1 hypothetical protein vnz_27595 [Streptomyces venezuelae]QES01794.1 hypothetical protein DEJ43_28040 [Streptomyces venezuelae ATCC 10712]
MAKPKPRHITVDGQPMVALTPQEYAALLSMRRQVGALGSRLRIVRETLQVTNDLLSALVTALEAERVTGCGPAADAGRPVTALLSSAPALIARAHRVAGKSRDRAGPRRRR